MRNVGTVLGIGSLFLAGLGLGFRPARVPAKVEQCLVMVPKVGPLNVSNVSTQPGRLGSVPTAEERRVSSSTYVQPEPVETIRQPHPESAVPTATLWREFTTQLDPVALDKLQEQLVEGYTRTLENSTVALAAQRDASLAHRHRALELLAAWESRRADSVATHVILEETSSELLIAAMLILPDQATDSKRQEALAPRFLELAATHVDERVRVQAVGLLSGWYPRAGEELQRIAIQDSSEVVRSAALACFALLPTIEGTQRNFLNQVITCAHSSKVEREAAQFSLENWGDQGS